MALTGLPQGAKGIIATGAQTIDMSDNTVLVEWEASLSKTTGLKIGDEITITFVGNIVADYWHLYSTKAGAHKPQIFEFDPGTTGLEITSPLRDVQKPHGEYDPMFMDSVFWFHEKRVEYRAKMKVTGENPNLEGYFSGQVCIDADHGGKCLPYGVEVKTKLTTTGSDDGTPDTGTTDTPPVDTATTPSDTAVADSDSASENAGTVASSGNLPTPYDELSGEDKAKKNKKNLIWIFLEAFLFGFAAVLTPCVFPMIPLTVTFFTKQSKTKAKGVRNALTYGFFIIAIYTGLGLTLSVALGPDFMYKMSINPWVNLAFFIILFVFALSFLGMFEITLPHSWANKIDSQSNRGGLIGIFFMALTLAVVSFSCTGPLVGTALIDAVGGSFAGPVLAMFGFSLAIAIPFGLLAMFPGWLNSLPKSGGWLNSVKVVLGFLELALGMKFLSQTDLVLKWHLLDREVFIGGWIVIFALLGLYLLGKLRLSHDSPVEKLSVPRLMLAIASFVFTLYLIPGLWGANLGTISGLLPPHNPDVGVRIIGQKNMNEGTFNNKVCVQGDRKYFDIFEEKEGHGFCTFYDLDEAMKFARKENMPVFLDFTGHTCANCRLMENQVWIDPKISKILKNEFVMVSLYCDENGKLEKPVTINGVKCRTIGDLNLQYSINAYNQNAQPYYVLMDPNFEVEGPKYSNLAGPRGYTPGIDDYEAFLKSGIEVYDLRHRQQASN